jgi:hypothetical protein
MVYRKTMLILPPKRLELLESSSSVATAWNDFFLFIFCSVARLFLNNKVKNLDLFLFYIYSSCNQRNNSFIIINIS